MIAYNICLPFGTSRCSGRPQSLPAWTSQSPAAGVYSTAAPRSNGKQEFLQAPDHRLCPARRRGEQALQKVIALFL